MNALVFAFIVGQGRPVHPGGKVVLPASAASKPVTAREAREAFTKVAALLMKTNGRPLGTTSIPAADRPATRAEIVAEMARLYKAAEPAFRFTPAPTTHDASKFRIDAAQKAPLDRLVTRGAVARIGPLAVGPTLGLTPKQFGDALGFFMARVSQLSHLPSPKWTPMLQGE